MISNWILLKSNYFLELGRTKGPNIKGKYICVTIYDFYLLAFKIRARAFVESKMVAKVCSNLCQTSVIPSYRDIGVNVAKSVTRVRDCLLEYELLLKCERELLYAKTVHDFGEMISA